MALLASSRTVISAVTILVAAVTFMLPAMGAQAAENKDAPKVLDVQRIEKTDVLEETRIERETLSGGYVCFKAFRRDTELNLTDTDLAALNLRPTNPGVKTKTKTTVSRWILVSISCVKE